MSPASGDFRIFFLDSLHLACFHSINVPSEWGLLVDFLRILSNVVSIQLMSPASGDIEHLPILIEEQPSGFHSINVPSEWGLH